MKISKRLETIASLIPEGSKVIDVGCDHALLDIFLATEKACKCIASDVNQNALDQAKYNISRFHAKNIETVLTDGLTDIAVEEEDIIVISGMGTSTIKTILEGRNLSHQMIIGTQTDFEDLRKYIVSLGYRIQNELYVEEKGKFYIIMDFRLGKEIYEECDFRYGPILKKNIDYLNHEQNKILEIMSEIPEEDVEFQCKKEILNEIEELKKNIL